MDGCSSGGIRCGAVWREEEKLKDEDGELCEVSVDRHEESASNANKRGIT